MANPEILSADRQKLLAQRLKGAGLATASSRRISPRPADAPPRLSFAQLQMWVIDQMTPGNPAYNLPVAYRLHGKLNIPALEASFNAIIARHESWRTSFHEENGEAVQKIHPAGGIQLRLVDLEAFSAAEREPRLQELAAEEAIQPFDLRHLPLVRVTLYQLASDEHVLLVNVPHIVADGLSLNLMFNELDELYRAQLSGEAPQLPTLPVQNADFAHWQQEEFTRGNYSKQLAHWQERLKGPLPVLELTTDQPRPPLQSFHGRNIALSIPRPLIEALSAIGAQEKSTFFVTILAAFEVFLLRHAPSQEVVIGTPVALRLPETEPLIGNFLNILPLRCDLSGNPTFIELLQRSRDSSLDALSNKELPFEMLVKALKLPRDPSRNPVFQTLLQVLPLTKARLGELAVSAYDFELRFAQFDLALSLYEQPDGSYAGWFQYCTDLFAPATLARWTQNFLTLLDEIARDSSQRVLEIPALSTAEQNQLSAWNQTEHDYPHGDKLHGGFERQARRTPHAIAVEFGEERLTYQELETRANQLAARLQALGIRANEIVGISVANPLAWVLGLLATLKAGGAYLPVDPSYPKDRRAFMLADAAPTVLLTERRLLDELPPHTATIICLDEASDSAEQPRSSNVGPDDLAYVIYTSGSTGKPKGVAVPHRGPVNMIAWQTRTFQVTETSRVLQFASFSFDASVWEVFMALTVGATLVLRSREEQLAPADLATFLREKAITHATFPPSLLALLPADDLPALRHVISAGEACPAALARRWASDRQFVNAYGPTEASVCVSSYLCTSDQADAPPIGRPIQNTQLYVLNEQLQPAPVGVPGELHIGGIGLARGYLHRPELTREKFISDPFSTDPSARLYKTGDLCRYLPDGNIAYLGRIDHQVKLRGFRVETGEIEAVLEQREEITDAFVIVREDAPGDQRLIAYLVCASPSDAAELRAALKAVLPDFMVPAAFVSLEALPLSPNGKVDRPALPIPEAAPRPQTSAAPETELERKIAAVWREVLRVEAIGRDDNFFELGGDSLLVMRVLNRLRELLSVPISMVQLFNAPTVAGLASALEATSNSTAAPSAIPTIARIPRTERRVVRPGS